MNGWTILSIFTFYAGSFNAVFARSVGTCTQGSADELFIGPYYSIVLYAIALIAMKLSRQERSVLIGIAPVILVVLWQMLFALQMSYQLLWVGISACELKISLPYRLDGRETAIAISWLAMALTVLLGLWIVWRSRVKQS